MALRKTPPQIRSIQHQERQLHKADKGVLDHRHQAPSHALFIKNQAEL